MKKTIEYLFAKKKKRRPISMVTAYDFPTAQIEDNAGIDAILVGDSVGTNVLGYGSEQEVTMADMLHHVAAVARGVKTAYLLADLPFGSVASPVLALKNARALCEKGVGCVKLEGWREKRGIVEHLSNNKIAVCAHIGYNPQVHGSQPKTFGRKAGEARLLVESALELEAAGAIMIVLEKIPAEVAGMITERLRIPTIGIGSGGLCDGQVLVINDILGTSERTFKHAKRYMDFHGSASAAVRKYSVEVEKGKFPGDGHAAHIDGEELEKLKTILQIAGLGLRMERKKQSRPL
jgi:3-methyl-2-oxobutanoate hydroxymethyltransferase